MEIKKIKKGNYIVFDGEPCIVKDLQFVVNKDTKANIVLEKLFTGEIIEASMSLHEQLQEADITRKCATIISKTKDKLEIMDMVSFETFESNVNSKLLEQANENDQVTYIEFDKTAKILEIRKQN